MALHEKTEDVKTFFRSFDKNGDGTISKDELKSIFVGFGDREIDAMIKAVDKNGDGVINYIEFSDWVLGNGGVTDVMMQMGEPVTSQDASVYAALKEAFEIADLDKSGAVTLDESLTMAKLIAEKFGQPYDEAQVKGMFSQGDLNKDGKVTLDEFNAFFKKNMQGAPNEVIFATIKMLSEMFKASKNGHLIFQLGTNNWQRPKKDGSGELEFAPGSGVLHEAHHNAYNEMPGVKCYSMYPSKNQAQPTDPKADYRVFELDHDIPICESASPNSSKRWHTMNETEFSAYRERLEKEVYDYMAKCEEKEGRKFTMVIAHHSFLNPLALRNVVQRRVKEGLPQCPLFCFVHGTALKMYRWELGGKSPEEFPNRFHKMIMEEKLFDDQINGVNACFVISNEQKAGIEEIFPCFPQDRVIVAPNGINVEKFKPREKSLKEVLVEQTREILWPAVPTSEDCGKYTQMIAFVGKAAEWKRQAALLYAASEYEKTFPNLATLCVGTGPDEELKKIKDLCQELGLKNTFLLGARGQDILAEIYTVSNLGCFPSFKEPFGLVFVECMACRTPVIGANSGGPKDFVSSDVGELVAEPPETSDLATVPLGVKTLGKTLNEAISRSLKEDWKTKKADACIKLAHDRFTVGSQVSHMLQQVAALK